MTVATMTSFIGPSRKERREARQRDERLRESGVLLYDLSQLSVLSSMKVLKVRERSER